MEPAGQRMRVELGAVDLDARCVVGTDIKLSPTEARLLARLAEAGGEPVDRERLLVDVWGHRPGSQSRTLFATVERLRKKIERDPRRPRHLLTVGGAGYAFRPLEEEPDARAVPAGPPAVVSDDTFVGRARELGVIASWLREPAPGPLTLRGPGGVGKTRLAREALARVPEGFATSFVDLSWCATFADVVEAVGRAMQLPLGRQEPDRHLVRIARVLCRAGPCLLVFDNAETVPAVLADVLRRWPTAAPHHLVTSRVALGLSDERVLVVEPLPVPDGDERSDATDLFDARGGVGQDRAAVAELVRFLEGTPLAIELAARWSKVLGPGAILDRLRASRLVLSAASGDPRPERHRTLAATVRWSWDALDPEDREALAACSVFRGGFDAEAADAVLPGDGLERLERLVERSLVRVERRGDARRFALLEVIRNFAAERLAERPTLARITLERHAAHYAALATDERLDRMARANGEQAWWGPRAELANLELAAAADAPEAAARAALLAAMTYRVLGPIDRAEPPLLKALERADELPPELHVRLLDTLGSALSNRGLVSDALATLHRARGVAEGRAPRALASVLQSIGILMIYHGSAEEASSYLDRAEVLYRDAGDDYGVAICVAERAQLDIRSGRSAEAVGQYQDALRTLRRLGARHAEAVYVGNLGVAQLKLRRFDAARASFLSSLELHRSLGTNRFDARTCCNLGLLEESRGRLEEALDYYRQSLDACHQFADDKSAGITQANIGGLLLRLGDLVGARRNAQAAEDAFADGSFPLHLADVNLTTAWIERVEGDLDAAERRLAKAEALIEQYDFAEQRVRLLAQRGLVRLGRGDRPGAEALLARGRRAQRALTGEHEALVEQELDLLASAIDHPGTS